MIAETLTPASTDELASLVREAKTIRVSGANSRSDYRLPGPPCDVSISSTSLTGIIDFIPDDQVVAVRAGTPLLDLQRELMQHGQCLPVVELKDEFSPLNLSQETVGGALSLNLPEYLEVKCGSWRDWILGVTVVLADGTVAKSGSRAVKNVAGYDLQKLFIGARGTLGVVVEVILRTWPLASLPTPDFRLANGTEESRTDARWIQRVLPSDFETAVKGASAYGGFDLPNSSLIWRHVPPDAELPRYAGDWVLRSGCGEKNLQFTDPTQIRLMRRAKEIFDPSHKLNPGEMGIF